MRLVICFLCEGRDKKMISGLLDWNKTYIDIDNEQKFDLWKNWTAFYAKILTCLQLNIQGKNQLGQLFSE